MPRTFIETPLDLAIGQAGADILKPLGGGGETKQIKELQNKDNLYNFCLPERNRDMRILVGQLFPLPFELQPVAGTRFGPMFVCR